MASLRRKGEALALSLPEAITKHDHTIAKDSDGVWDEKCVAVRRGGEQLEANLSSQSSQTRRLNPIRPIGVASLPRKGEALTCW